MKKGINQIFKEMNSGVNDLGKKIDHTSFEDKLKTALPLAIIASIITLLGYFLINFLSKL
ncbi:MAG: hypothetical protein GX752_09380 [Clostridium sp.]|nr:hypothetical protein [Clostridium sp.]